jgi:hypothetical protein
MDVCKKLGSPAAEQQLASLAREFNSQIQFMQLEVSIDVSENGK